MNTTLKLSLCSVLMAAIFYAPVHAEELPTGIVNPLSSGLLSSRLTPSSMNINDPISMVESTKERQLFILPLSFFASGFEIGVEKQLALRKAIRFSAGYFFSPNAWAYNDFSGNWDRNYENMEAGRFELQYRFFGQPYLDKDNFYAGAYSVFKTLKMDAEDSEWDPNTGIRRVTPRTFSSSALSLGVLAGYVIRAYDFLSIDVHIGGGITPTSWGDHKEVHMDIVSPYTKSINFKAGFSVGIKI
jgi:hypothetical protein